jgi:PiT family inorganic phosphate transporter
MVAIEPLLIVGLVVAVFVGFNIGGSSTGVAFGAAVGTGVLSKLAAAALMTVFAVLGGWTVGRNVVKTMGGDIVPSALFTPEASVAVLFFIGLALLVSNTFGVPASTSMTAVGAIAGLEVAKGRIDWVVMGQIVSWWLVSPIIAFWVCAVVGRYLYPTLERHFSVDRTPGGVPSGHASRREVVGTALVVLIGCYMAFSAGASNTANAVAPLVGSEEVQLSVEVGVLLAGAAIGLGAFTIARRTLGTVGNDLTDLPLLAAIIVEIVLATIIAGLSWAGIPASLAVSATTCIVGLGWGRATRQVTVRDAVASAAEGERTMDTTLESLAGERTGDATVPRVGRSEEPGERSPGELFDPHTTARVVSLWILTPSLSAATAYLLFRFAPFF